MKAAVYCGTKNIYKDMIPSMKSLLVNSDVDKIYFLIEDDNFPYELPNEVECINISTQPYFSIDGPNFNSSWTYMILIKAAFTKIFPHLDTILSLDYDTIVNENISELWDMDISDYYVAGVREPKKSKGRRPYINSGVVLFNLKKIRDDKKDDELIHNLNSYFYFYPEQDAINELFANKILELPSDYNVNNYAKRNCKSQKIIHFAAIKNWQNFPIVRKYRNMDVMRNKPTKIDLDIIIPFYNNIEGLETTLKSVVYEDLANINITVVDDCSNVDYEDIKDAYPTVNFLRLETNSGPGIARQYGIDNTHNKYIMFIDTGDYILSKYSLIEVLETIKSNSVPYMYLWRWLNEEHNTYSSDWNPLLHGWVIKRDFIELYNIRFSEISPRSNEDIGFIQCCNIMLRDLKSRDKTEYFCFKEAPIYMYTYDANSITHANQKLYMYTKHIQGLALNGAHIYKFCIKNNVSMQITYRVITKIMLKLYHDLLSCAQNKPEFLPQNWQHIRKFYFDVYKQFEKVNQNYLQYIFSNELSELNKLKSVYFPYINWSKFITDLNVNEQFNIRYNNTNI